MKCFVRRESGMKSGVIMAQAIKLPLQKTLGLYNRENSGHKQINEKFYTRRGFMTDKCWSCNYDDDVDSS